MILVLYFGYSWVMSNLDSKLAISQLQNEYVKLFLKKKENDDSILKIRDEFVKLKQLESDLRRDNLRLLKEVESAERNANVSKIGLDKLKRELDESKKKIDEFKRNPVYKDGNHLLESIKKWENEK
jgi:hypothetical protein